MNRITSAAKVAALIIGVLILGSVADVAYAEQRPGDCGYYINSNGYRAGRPDERIAGLRLASTRYARGWLSNG
jgi:hypothetical protein